MNVQVKGLLQQTERVLRLGALPLMLTSLLGNCAQAPFLSSSTTVQIPDQAVVPSPSPSIATAVSNWQRETVVQGLSHPWSMAWLPNGDILITERPGRLRIVRQGKLDPMPIAGVPDVLAVGQGGLLDVSLHPRFAQNQLVYLTYAYGTSQANRTRVARGRLDGQSLQNLQVIFEVSQAKSGGQHFGSRMLWLPDGTLLVSIGDGGNPPVQLAGDLIRKQAQNRGSHLGKILRLNDDGSAPPNNPFVGQPNAAPVVWSYGHRNLQGIAFDPIQQRVWSTEHGARGGDELNLIVMGKNYGWPIVTFSREYSGPSISEEQSRAGMVDPKLVWTPAIAPSGLAFYTADRFPQWRESLFAGGLVSQDVRRLQLDATGNVRSQEAMKIGQRVRDVRQGPDGWLYILTDDAANGQLIRLGPAA